MIRLEQKSIDSFKMAMQKFFPHYMNMDLNLPKEYKYEFGMFLDILSYKVEWTNITYTNADLDIKDMKINLTTAHDTPMVKVNLPAFKKWEIDAHQEVNTWILPSDSKVELIFKDFDIDFKSNFKVDNNGYLDPIVYEADIKFGDSYLYH